MIESIDIANFGCFSSFEWKTQVKNESGGEELFHRVNILYGRNYTGKTTLSRIFRSLETKVIPSNYKRPSFFINPKSENLSQDHIDSFPYDIRVYNKDFVEENLSFLKDENEGKINSFAVLGKRNVDITNSIKKLAEKIGSIENKNGLAYENYILSEEMNKLKSYSITENKKLDDSLKDKANNKKYGIKYNKLYDDINYDIRKIKKDLREVIRNRIEPLERSEVDDLTSLSNEKPLPDLQLLEKPNFQLSNIHSEVRSLITKIIKPSKPIQELLNDRLLQNWVKEGIPLHDTSTTQCGFCRQELPIGFWDSLNAHFSKESSDLEKSLDSSKERIEEIIEQVSNIVLPQKDQFYKSFQDEFSLLANRFSIQIEQLKGSLRVLADCLISRKNDIFTPAECPTIVDVQEELEGLIESINELFKKNSKVTSNLSNQKKKAIDKLRKNEIKIFIDQINYEERSLAVTEKENELKLKEEQQKTLLASINDAEEKIQKLEAELGNEQKGAEKVNLLLNHYFGNKRLNLVPIQDDPDSSVRFQIKRKDEVAYNLSEGECSLVAFCYFMAKLEDINSVDKDLIIYIDDPISSLDSNHIFFIYSLIEGLIASPDKLPTGENTYRYKQLFISTHNLDFLKYLKRLSIPKKPGSKRKDIQHFMISERTHSNVIEIMPKYLKSYVTEFNYLFSEICNCAEPLNSSEDHHSFYNFGNNLRKFLEAFLYFKYPYTNNENEDHKNKIADFFGGNPIDAPLVHRITNEYSHLVSIFDRSMQPIDNDEIAKMARFVLQKIKANDPAQYQGLLKSVDKQDPLL